VKRGGTVLALAVLFSFGLTPAAAQDGTGTADVFLKERGGRSFAGEDLLSVDGAGQSRSLIIRDRIIVIVKIQNDGHATETFTIEGSAGVGGFALRYLRRGTDITDDVTAGDLSLKIPAGKTRVLRVEIDADDAAFAAEQLLLVRATNTGSDAALAKITKIS
jgi:hypothetical protein